ncbi:MAG TPA: histidine phosphatase family protein [Trichormus sp.]|jgi:broad specificity phosphatase PhoE
MKKVIFVRHGATESNIEGKMRGWSDDPLSDLGRKQAQLTAQYLKGFAPVERIFTSTLPRSIETGEAIESALNVGIEKLEELRELNLGDLEGGTERELWEYFTKNAFDKFGKRRDIALPGGEAISAFLDRIEKGFALIWQQHPQGTVLVVSHGVANMVALGKWLEPKNILFWPKFRLDNCSVTEVEFAPEPRLLRLNDTSHLQAIVR